MKIEFFHDVLCSFCFPMSSVMRKLAAEREDVEIIHRSYALAWEDADYIRAFGTRERVKDEVLGHWARANELDEEHRFNIEGMREADFLFPLSRKPLIAAKAAGLIAGEEGYWAVFDALQLKLFVENKNIEDEAVLEEAVEEAGINLNEWRRAYQSKEAEEAVLEDIKKAASYNLPSVPCLIVDEKHMIFGAKSLERLNKKLDDIQSGTPQIFSMR